MCHIVPLRRILPDIILLVKAKEFSDLGSTLGPKALGLDSIGQAWNVTFTLLDDRECEDREILSNDAATDRLSLAFTGSAWAVAGVTVGEEESDTSGEHLLVKS